MKKGWVFLVGAALGGAIGWVVGVLSAPRSGQETVNVLSNRAIELSNRMGLYGCWEDEEELDEAEAEIPLEAPAESDEATESAADEAAQEQSE